MVCKIVLGCETGSGALLMNPTAANFRTTVPVFYGPLKLKDMTALI